MFIKTPFWALVGWGLILAPLAVADGFPIKLGAPAKVEKAQQQAWSLADQWMELMLQHWGESRVDPLKVFELSSSTITKSHLPVYKAKQVLQKLVELKMDGDDLFDHPTQNILAKNRANTSRRGALVGLAGGGVIFGPAGFLFGPPVGALSGLALQVYRDYRFRQRRVDQVNAAIFDSFYRNLNNYGLSLPSGQKERRAFLEQVMEDFGADRLLIPARVDLDQAVRDLLNGLDVFLGTTQNLLDGAYQGQVRGLMRELLLKQTDGNQLKARDSRALLNAYLNVKREFLQILSKANLPPLALEFLHLDSEFSPTPVSDRFKYSSGMSLEGAWNSILTLLTPTDRSGDFTRNFLVEFESALLDIEELDALLDQFQGNVPFRIYLDPQEKPRSGKVRIYQLRTVVHFPDKTSTEFETTISTSDGKGPFRFNPKQSGQSDWLRVFGTQLAQHIKTYTCKQPLSESSEEQ